VNRRGDPAAARPRQFQERFWTSIQLAHGPTAGLLRRAPASSSNGANEAFGLDIAFGAPPDPGLLLKQLSEQASVAQVPCRAGAFRLSSTSRASSGTWPQAGHSRAGRSRDIHLAVSLQGQKGGAGSKRGLLGTLTRPARWIGGKGRRNCDDGVAAAVDWNHL